ncbi:hypothetical protein DOY81_010547 [Sarcophaga bullata]|nr:hypothetical protein DOY81_010547 [Sarcophaga bullata]
MDKSVVGMEEIVDVDEECEGAVGIVPSVVDANEKELNLLYTKHDEFIKVEEDKPVVMRRKRDKNLKDFNHINKNSYNSAEEDPLQKHRQQTLLSTKSCETPASATTLSPTNSYNGSIGSDGGGSVGGGSVGGGARRKSWTLSPQSGASTPLGGAKKKEKRSSVKSPASSTPTTSTATDSFNLWIARECYETVPAETVFEVDDNNQGIVRPNKFHYRRRGR